MEVWECGGITSGVFLGFFDDHYCVQPDVHAGAEFQSIYFFQSLKKLLMISKQASFHLIATFKVIGAFFVSVVHCEAFSVLSVMRFAGHMRISKGSELFISFLSLSTLPFKLFMLLLPRNKVST